MGNCVALTDNNGNKKLYKARREQKIDNVAAMLDAYVAFKSFPDFF
jgi:phage terminase large subunit-like protein